VKLSKKCDLNFFKPLGEAILYLFEPLGEAFLGSGLLGAFVVTQRGRAVLLFVAWSAEEVVAASLRDSCGGDGGAADAAVTGTEGGEAEDEIRGCGGGVKPGNRPVKVRRSKSRFPFNALPAAGCSGQALASLGTTKLNLIRISLGPS